MNHQTAAILICLGCLLPGCSEDKHIFRSTVYRPTSVLIRDTVHDTVIWRKDIPVDHQLVMNLDRTGDSAPFKLGPGPAEHLSWYIKNERTGTKIAKGGMALPGLPILIERMHRSSPELPPGYLPPGAVATTQPAEAPSEAQEVEETATPSTDESDQSASETEAAAGGTSAQDAPADR